MISSDISARQEALNPNKSFIVQASAGCGKTEILVQRYLNLLSFVEQPEEIIALTFTNKAANEMRHRIYEALANAESGFKVKENYRRTTFYFAQKALLQNNFKNWQLLLSPNRLQIMTIDAFCQKLKEQLLFKTNDAFDVNITDDAEPLYDQTIDDLIKYTKKSSPFYNDLHYILEYFDNDISRIKSLFSNMLATREQWVNILLRSKFDNCREEKKVRISIESSFNALFIELRERLIPLLKLQQNKLILNKILLFCKKGEEPQLVNLYHPYFWQRLIELLFTKKNTFRKTFNVKQGLPTKDVESRQYIEWLKQYISGFHDSDIPEIQELIAELRLYERLIFNHEEWKTLSVISRLSLRLLYYLKLTFKKYELIDFNEVFLQTLSAFNENDSSLDTTLYFNYRIKHLLIDEFQDTSLSHFKILKILTLKWTNSEKNTLFLVGDPMQSIYRFRQAEVNLFLEVKNRGINRIKVQFLELTCNFRSQGSIVHWVNKSFYTIFPQKDSNYGGIRYKPASTVSKKISGEVFTCELFKDSVEEGLFIANSIKKYLKKNPKSKIAILVQTRKHVKSLTDILQSSGISVNKNEIEAFHEQPIIMDLVCLCAILINPGQSTYWISLLQSQLFGFPLSELENIARLQLDGTEKDRSEFFYKKLQIYLRNKRNQPYQMKALYFLNWLLSNFFHGVRSRLSSRLRIIWKILDGFNIYSYDNLFNEFISLMESHLTQDKTSIGQFDYFLIKLKKTFINVSSPNSSTTVMTIHKSKGLEFDFVILPQLNKQGRKKHKSLFLHDEIYIGGDKSWLLLSPIKHSWKEEDSNLYKIIWNIQKKRTEYEFQRLLYVAVTRAKSKLLFTATIENTFNKGRSIMSRSRTFLTLLEPFLKVSKFRQENSNLLRSSSLDRKKFIYDYKLIRQIENYFTPPKPTFYDNIDTYCVETHLKNENLSECLTNHDKQIGLALHQLFNYLSMHPKRIGNWKDYFLTCLHQYAVDKANYHKAEFLAKISIKNTIDHFPWVLYDYGLCEQIMIEYKMTRANQYISDRIIIKKDEYHVIDYKFSTPSDELLLSSFLTEQKKVYKDQLQKYKELVVCHFMVDPNKVRTSLYFPLIPEILSI